MFGIFKKKSQKDKLLALYNKKKEQAFKLSKHDRRKSDEKEMEASEILKALDELEKNKEK